ncbi:hypothetical protein [Anaeromyxobacter terrae]|uniref:hypothetical protein n=1 Tax=Anaeromyxobacter terrae TaxID=2925406 RepID=UPI001F580D54|nr:hypothetical protein [Anaeromyxobacter sp. SG22]
MELGRARTLDAGEWDLGAAIGFSGYGHERTVPQEHPTGDMVLPLVPVAPVELWAARGIAPRLEVDGRLSVLSAQLGVKAQAVRTQHLDLSLAATGIAALTGRPELEPTTRARLALIAGVPLFAGFELDLAPQCSWNVHPVHAQPELWGATGQLHYGPLPGGMRRIGLAVSVLRYERSTAARPGDVTDGRFVGVALVFSARGPPVPVASGAALDAP